MHQSFKELYACLGVCLDLMYINFSASESLNSGLSLFKSGELFKIFIAIEIKSF